MAAAGRLGRHGQRAATLILLAYRHGLRVSERVSLRSEQIDKSKLLPPVTPSVLQGLDLDQYELPGARDATRLGFCATCRDIRQ